jgi:DNA-binding Lrp family transcriptional regulator
MVTAYILINVASGTETEVGNELLNLKEIKDLNVVYGEYDLIIKVELKNMEDLQDFIINKVRSIKAIKRTSTMIAVK